MKLLFCMVPAYGHINPTLATAAELVRRGVDVVYAAPEQFAERIVRTGATVRLIDDRFCLPKALTEVGRGSGNSSVDIADMFPHLMYMMRRSLQAVPDIVEQIQAERIDGIVYDPMAGWGRALAHKLTMPAVTFYISYPLTRSLAQQVNRLPRYQKLPGIVASLAKLLGTELWLTMRHGLPFMTPTSLFRADGDLNIVTIPRSFQPDADQFGEHFLFVGPTITPRAEHVDFLEGGENGKPLIYIALGTLLTDWATFFRTCIDAFGNQPYRVLMSIGQTPPESLGSIPSNVTVRSYVPQLEVLKQASVFLSHGGMNSTMEALWFGVPLIVVPRLPELALTAANLERLGLGISLSPENITKETLQQAVARLLHDHSLQQRMSEMQEEMRFSGGATKAAESLMEYFSARNTGSVRKDSAHVMTPSPV